MHASYNYHANPAAAAASTMMKNHPTSTEGHEDSIKPWSSFASAAVPVAKNANAVTVDPNLDLDDEFALFHPDLDQEQVQVQNQTANNTIPSSLSTSVSASVSTSASVPNNKPLTRDIGVNTDLPYAATNFYAMYHLYPHIEY
jgi:hypothetical protein